MKMHGTSVTVIFAVIFFATTLQAQIIVQTSDGKLGGKIESQVAGFKAIPYAAPPIGELRLKPPMPPKSWKGIRTADRFSAGCMQHRDISRGPWTEQYMLQGPISEDCLYLNVWTPADFRGRHLPVYVFFHGGGFIEGSGSIDVYDGANMARRGLVFVTVNYRLGALGFLVHPALSAESPHHVSGNYGLLDGIASLQWVQQNIAAFGGDPTRVTIGGQSAGSAMVHDLIASPFAKGLFRAGVAESGSSLSSLMSALPNAEGDGKDFAESLKARTAEDLRKLPAEAFLPAPDAPRTIRFRPAVDGWYLPLDPLTAGEQGKANDAPLLTGMQADEGSGNAPKTYGKIPAEEWHVQVKKMYGNMATRFEELYPAADNAAASIAEKESARERGEASMYLFCSRIAGKQTGKIYTYYFNRAIPWPEHSEFGAHHTGETVYILSNLDKLPRPFTQEDRAVAATMSGYLFNFVSTGDPNGGGLPEWKSFETNSPQTLEIAPTTKMRPLMSVEKLEFWKAYFDSPLSKNAPPI